METMTTEEENEAREDSIPMIGEDSLSTGIRTEEPRGENNRQFGSGPRENRERTFQGNHRNLEANSLVAARLADRPTVEVTRYNEAEPTPIGPSYYQASMTVTG